MAGIPTGGGSLPPPVHSVSDGGPPFQLAPMIRQPSSLTIAKGAARSSVPTSHGSIQTKPYPSQTQSHPFNFADSTTTSTCPSTISFAHTEFPPLPSHLHQANVTASSILNPNAPSQPPKSFIDVVSASKPSPASISVKPMTLHRGEPAVIFSTDEISIMAAPFKLSLIGKFSFGRPSMDTIRKFFVALGLKGNSQVSLLDQRHVLINLSLEEDYTRVWIRQTWFINGKAMRMFKWSANFRCAEESPIVPVWISLPYLPIHFVNCKQALYSIAAAVGKPLRVDHATATGNMPSVARILIEYDISKSLLPRIWIGEGNDGFWQDIIFEKVPTFCSACKHLGHDQNNCYIANPSLREKFMHKRESFLGKTGVEVNAHGAKGAANNTNVMKADHRNQVRDKMLLVEKGDCIHNTQQVLSVSPRVDDVAHVDLYEHVCEGAIDNAVPNFVDVIDPVTTLHGSLTAPLVPSIGKTGPSNTVQCGLISSGDNLTWSNLISCQREGFRAAYGEAFSTQQNFISNSVTTTADVGLLETVPGPSVALQPTLNERQAQSVISGPSDAFQPTRTEGRAQATSTDTGADERMGHDLSSLVNGPLGPKVMISAHEAATPSRSAPVITMGQHVQHGPPSSGTSACQQLNKARAVQPNVECNLRPTSFGSGLVNGFDQVVRDGVIVSIIDDTQPITKHAGEIATQPIPEDDSQHNSEPNSHFKLVQQQEDSLAHVDVDHDLDSTLGHQPNINLTSEEPLAVQSVKVSKEVSGGLSCGSSSSVPNSFSFQAGHHISYNPNPTVVVVDSLPMPRPTYASEDYLTEGTIDDSDSFFMPDHSHVELNTHSPIIPDESYYGPVSRSHSLDEQELRDDDFRIIARCGVSDSAIDKRIHKDADGFTKVTPRKARQYHLRPRNRRR